MRTRDGWVQRPASCAVYHHVSIALLLALPVDQADKVAKPFLFPFHFLSKSGSRILWTFRECDSLQEAPPSWAAVGLSAEWCAGRGVGGL